MECVNHNIIYLFMVNKIISTNIIICINSLHNKIATLLHSIFLLSDDFFVLLYYILIKTITNTYILIICLFLIDIINITNKTFLFIILLSFAKKLLNIIIYICIILIPNHILNKFIYIIIWFMLILKIMNNYFYDNNIIKLEIMMIVTSCNVIVNLRFFYIFKDLYTIFHTLI